MSALKKIIKKISPNGVILYHLYKQLVKNKNSYLHETGWIKGLELKYPCDKEGNEVPWMNFSVITFLKHKLTNQMSLFEFGSGFSTVFYSKLVKNVVSVEYNPEWYEMVKRKVSDNVELLHILADTDGKYCRAIVDSKKQFDIVVIDGRDRVNCIKQSVLCLTENGVIIFDDSNRTKYQEGKDCLLNKGFKSLEFEGLKPGGYGELVQTTIFYRDNNIFGI